MPVTRSQSGKEDRPAVAPIVVFATTDYIHGGATTATATSTSQAPPAQAQASLAQAQAILAQAQASPAQARASPAQARATAESPCTYTSFETEETEESEHTAVDKRPRNEKRNIMKADAPPRPASERATNKRRELELRAEIQMKEMQEARAAAALARTQLELMQLDDEDHGSVIMEPEGREKDVQDWVQHQTRATSEEEPGKPSEERRIPEQPTASTKDKEARGKNLADAIIKAIQDTPKMGSAPPAYIHELPIFDGNSNEWLAFKTVYEDTAPLFSPTQNMARLRRAIKGSAREAIKSQLYSDISPNEVLEALRRRFGRPDALVRAEMEKIKNLPKVTDNPRDICIFASHVNNAVATIRGLRKPMYLHSPDIMKIIIEKLPTVLKYRWYDFTADQEDHDLMLAAKFLNREADRCGPYASEEVTTFKKQQSTRQATHSTSEQREKPPCPSCQEDHALTACKKFLQTSVKDRWEIAKKSRNCFKCLLGRHRKETCRKPPCKHCKRWHHTLLHEDRSQGDYEPKQNERKEIANNIRLQANAANNSRAYLKMVPVEIYGPRGTARILALLDEGSTVTLLDASIAEEVGLKGPKTALHIETVGGKTITKRDSMKIGMKIRGIHQRATRVITSARTIDELHLSPQKMDKLKIEECPHLKKLADQLFNKEERPKLLIGQDNWELIVSRTTRKGKKNQPVASLTHLGWVLHGSDGGAARQVNFITAHVNIQEDDNMEQLIKEHFAIESLGVQARRPSTDAEGKALAIMEKTTRRLESGRFETGLIWKKEDIEMPDNYKTAENRLRTIEKKLDRDTDIKMEYEKQIQNLLDKGYAEEIAHSSTSKRKWYLPHFAVTHPTKKKMRLVFDAAAKSGGTNLNDTLLPGPDLLQSLFGVLLRFRQFPVAVMADIKEMFLQIKMKEEDRDSLRFLWRGDQRTGTPKEYRMTSVIFGATCSPSSAIFIKNKNAAEFKEEYPDAAEAIEKNHYMDDYLQSFESDEEAIKTASEVDLVHRKACFELRGWASNRPNVLQALTHDQDAQNKEVELGSKEEKTLGLRWFTENDEMGFRTSLRNEIALGKTPTKREVTSAVMSTFDPMGLASPILIQGKRLIQDIWRSGIGWDENIIPKDEEIWKNYMESIDQLKSLRIPRRVMQSGTEGELHIFTDASEKTYSCAAYWRQQGPEGAYHVTLLAGKARVTPLKPVSIPRLELQAALLGARMAKSIEEEMNVKPKTKTYWTDSSTVLSWIKADPRNFKTFVAHRLAEIEDTTKPQEWRWVPTAQNPADDATRSTPKNFDGNHRWFNGPDFLRKEEGHWPRARTSKSEPTGEEKEKSTTAAVKIREALPTPEPARFSSWNRLMRATARIFQFIDLSRKKMPVNLTRKEEKNDPTWKKNPIKMKTKKESVMKKTQERRFLLLDPVYMEKAEKLLLQRSQEETFREELIAIKKENLLERSSKLKKLDTTMENGLLRIRGRINAATNLGDSLKRPTILDSNHPITRLIIKYFHENFNHGNHTTVINELRQKYWILGLRAAVKSIVHNCQWCRVYRGKPQAPPTGDLPRERLQYGDPPFTCLAVDYFGPMIVTVGRRHEKRWGALFCCLTTRAVHVEMAASLSADSMILALRRLVARRGSPKTIFSDNGTNLVKANKDLREALQDLKEDDMATETEKMGIRWKFIPPGAPNMGGAWERLVRSIKTALAVTLHERHPKEETLHTLLLEAEHIVNSRPLIETDTEDNEALTPNHFLIGRSNGTPRIGIFDEHDLKGRREWRIAQRMTDVFWSRWLKEYLPTLVPRKIDGGQPTRDLRRGDVILIVDPTLPRNTWPRGKIIGTYPGTDGRTRIIEVRTNGGILKRPSSKAVLLVPAQDDGLHIVGPGYGAAHEGEDVDDPRP